MMCSLWLHQCSRLSQRDLSILSMNAWESSQREVVTDSAERLDFPYWQINSSRSLGRRLADRCPCELHAGEFAFR